MSGADVGRLFHGEQVARERRGRLAVGHDRPIVRRAVGSTSSTARVLWGMPKNCSNCRGTIDDHRPELACETRLKIELVSTEGAGFAPTERNTPSMMRRFCMSGVSRHSGAAAASLQEIVRRSA